MQFFYFLKKIRLVYQSKDRKLWVKTSFNIGFLIFSQIDVIVSTLRDFLDWVKILYTNKSNAEVWACEVWNWNYISKIFLYEEFKTD